MTAATDPSGLADAQRVRDAVLACPDVAALSAGPFGEVASYFSGQKVAGVRIDADRVEVHVVARYGTPLPQLADELGRLLAAHLTGRALQVVVTDLLLPGETLEPDVPTGGDTGDQ